MGDEDNDGLMLNISQDKPFSFLKSHSKTQHGSTSPHHKKGSNKSHNVKRISKDLDSGGIHQGRKSKAVTKMTETDNEKRKNNPGDEGKPFQVISSLFSKNPEIPEVEKDPAFSKAPSAVLFCADSFTDFNLPTYLLQTLNDLGFIKLTTIQKFTIPVLLSGKDTLVKSPTGSGKTLAYALPIIQQLQAKVPEVQRSDGPYALILLPTRELAVQSYNLFQELCKSFVRIVPGLIIGGEKRKAEKARLRKGINIIVATPGRLLDHIATTKCLQFDKVSYVVLDEADRLLDLGFEKKIAEILTQLNAQCKTNRQNILVSATLHSGVQNLASISLTNPTFVDASKESVHLNADLDLPTKKDNVHASKLVIPDSLRQHFVIVPGKLRLMALTAFILQTALIEGTGKMIVFLSSRKSVEFHHQVLSSILIPDYISDEHFRIFKLHGRMLQQERHEMFQKFKESNRGVLISTDVAARGLDLPQVSQILQYTCPPNPDEYLHRVGRTARIGREGQATLIVLPSEVKYLKLLESRGVLIEEMKLFDILEYLVVRPAKKINQTTIQDSSTELQLKFEDKILSDKKLLNLAEGAYQSFVQSYATYPSSVKYIFHLKHLHLGHIAKSFALRETPQNIGQKQLEDKLDPVGKKDKFKFPRKRKADDKLENLNGLVVGAPRLGKRTKKSKKKGRKLIK